MSLLFEKHFLNHKIINWRFTHKNLSKLQNRVVQQIEKKDFRKVRNLQRLILKSISSHLLASQKILEIQELKNSNFYKVNRKDVFLHIFNLNNYIQLEKSLCSNSSPIYFQFLCLLWVFALLPLHETLASPFSYNYRLYRDQTDILQELSLVLNLSTFKWMLILKPNGFLKIKNKKWLFQHLLIEKKFLWLLLESKEVANCLQQDYNNYNENKQLSETKKISLTKILKNYSVQNYKSVCKTCLSPKNSVLKLNSLKTNIKEKQCSKLIIYYNDLILVPNRNLNQLKMSYKFIFEFLNIRGLYIKKNRIWVLNLKEGFNFLGWFLKKEREKPFITISSQNIRSHQLEIKKCLKSSRFLPIDKVITKLNKKIVNWQAYYAYTSNLRKTWSNMNYYLFWRIWRWCQKRHKTKGSKWLYHRYWVCREHGKWIFHANYQYLKSYNFKKQKIIYLPASVNVCKIKNFKKIQPILLKKYKDYKV